ncbi:seven-hairpin glycosidase [Trichodelitschia bisporula]|uniref:alpha-1,2-Mannosidase n=1 Tax=Trichodelitschia bisporula TaxID=703511 RepID=A0A6G1I5N5_9PEZI|nr:seven-hairpin glycosidase [Trichodelitschia bisporula]
MARWRRSSAITVSKFLCAAIIIAFYLLYTAFHRPAPSPRKLPLPKRPSIQLESWKNGTGRADEDRREEVRRAMQHTFWGYRKRAWGHDDLKPVSGGFQDTRNGWGAFIVDSSTTLALMGLWDELDLALDFIVNDVDFSSPKGLVDPFETTIRYLGALVSLVDLADARIIPPSIFGLSRRSALIHKATVLGTSLLPAYDSPTGLPWPRVNFTTKQGEADPPEVYELDPSKPRRKNPAIGPARAGSSILENCVLSRLTGNQQFCKSASLAWAPLIWSKFFVKDAPGLVDSPVDIVTGEPVGRDKQWDAGHDSYYEYLLKASLLLSGTPEAKTYTERWTQAASALRHNLSSRASASEHELESHLYAGKLHGPWFVNEMSHLACFAPGNVLLGARALKRPDLVPLGLALLDGCRHVYAASPLGIGPESWSWIPSGGQRAGAFEPKSQRAKDELAQHGFWTAKAYYKLRPEYVESLFYAWRITGQSRYREWAWEAFQAWERWCRTELGYAGVQDVMAKEGEVRLDDEAESFWAAETLKYAFLIFEDVKVASLDDWIFSTEGHLFWRGAGRKGKNSKDKTREKEREV